MRFLLFFALLFTQQSFAQRFHLYEDSKFYDQHIDVAKMTNESISVKLYFQSSEQCACESVMTVVLKKKPNGTYVGHPYGHKEEVITAKMLNGKVQSIRVKTETYGCCNIYGGVYLSKKKGWVIWMLSRIVPKGQVWLIPNIFDAGKLDQSLHLLVQNWWDFQSVAFWNAHMDISGNSNWKFDG